MAFTEHGTASRGSVMMRPVVRVLTCSVVAQVVVLVYLSRTLPVGLEDPCSPFCLPVYVQHMQVTLCLLRALHAISLLYYLMGLICCLISCELLCVAWPK